jgi:L-ascorbate metabolism protein UlaG (beta-lactamase superfamily)
MKYPPDRRWTRKAWLGASAAGLAGTGTLLYKAAPGFWNQYTRELKRPIAPAPLIPDPSKWPDTGLHAAWIGHSSVLLKIDGFTILTDPVFSVRAGIHLGFTTVGVKRLVSPALDLLKLPHVDLILLSHAHMDHFDLPSLRRLEKRRTTVVTAAKTSDLLRVDRYGSVHELGWGEEHRVGPVSVRGLEVNHWGARVRTDTYRGYNGYLITAGRYRVLFAGDTANTDKLRKIAGSNRVDLAIMPIGAYDPWIRFHCTPEQAWRMGQEAAAEYFLPVHHSTFQLSREPLMEPLERLHAAAGRDAERIVMHRIGEEFQIS